MSIRSMRCRQNGLSLVELGVALVIAGIIGIFVWRWVTATQAPMQRSAMIGQLVQAQAAIEGFVLAHHRLPCATASTAGVEDCSDASAAAVLLPWRTLGLSSRYGQLHYGVNRGGGMDLAGAPAASVSPDLNIDYSPAIPIGTQVAVADAIDAATGRRNQVNGLDWCRVIRRLAAASDSAGVLRAGNAANDLSVAYIVAHPGANGVFEGNNVVGNSAAWRFDLPGRAQAHDFDDLALAVGAADLSARMGCPARLGAMLGAAQAAYTAYDSARVAQEYWSLLEFDITQAESAVSSAETGVAMAAMNVALAAAGAAKAIVSASNTEGVTIFGIALSIVSTVEAGIEVGFAAADLAAANASLTAAQTKEADFRDYMAHVYATFTQALNTAVLLDQKGLNP